MKEEWRDVVGYEGLYKISNKGRVKSPDRKVNSRYGCKRLIKGKILTSGLKGDPYQRVRLYKGEVFGSAYEAMKFYKINSTGNICAVCNNRRKHAGSYSDGTLIKWEYYKIEEK